MLKQFLKALPWSQLIDIANEIAKLNIPKNYKVTFASTESSDATGSEDVDYVVGDNLIIFSNEDIDDDELNKVIKKIKLVFELQSSKYYDPHYTMGARLYLYCINGIEREKINGEYVYNVPSAITIYTTLDLPKFGVDSVSFNFPSFWVKDKQYFGEDGDFFRLEYNYVNLLAFDFDDFEDTVFDVFNILYMYRYRKDINLMLKEDFKTAMRDISYKIENYNGKIFDILISMYEDLTKDIVTIANTNTKKYGKVIDDMREVEMSYGQKLVAKARSEGKEEGVAIGVAKGVALERIKIAKLFGIPLNKIDEMLDNHTPLENPPII